MKFKIGDKVKIKAGVSLSSQKLDGKICTIETTNSDYCILVEEEEELEYSKGGVWCDEIELYEEEFPVKWAIRHYPETLNWIRQNAERNGSSIRKSEFYFFPCDCAGNNYYKYSFPEDYTEITLEQFKKHILKESATMKNLLETEFVIENCTLSQRLAIKAYCDEKKIRIYEDSFNESSCKGFPNLAFNKSYFVACESVANRNEISFSELIQFLDQYQPEPEFKVGDFVYFDGNHHKAGPYLLKERISDGQFKDSNNETRDIKESKGRYRHATPEEIKKWKEENEIKLPTIEGKNGLVITHLEKEGKSLKWGCTEISIATVKELLELKLTYINFDDGREADYKQIQLIKKFIDHNKL